MAEDEHETKAHMVLAVDATIAETLGAGDRGWFTTPEFTLAMCESLMIYVSDCLKPDVLAFAAHAKRKSVTVEDILLVTRRSPSITEKLLQMVEKETAKRAEAASNKKRLKSADDKSKKKKKTSNAAKDEYDDETEKTQSDFDADSNAENHYEEDMFAD